MARSPLGRQQGVERLRADPDAVGFLLRLYSSGLWSQEPKDRGAHTVCIFPKRPSVYQWLSPAIALGAPSFVLPFPLQALLFWVSRTGGWERRKKIHKTLLKKLRNIKIFSSHGMNTGVYYRSHNPSLKHLGPDVLWNSDLEIQDWVNTPQSNPFRFLQQNMTSHTKREKVRVINSLSSSVQVCHQMSSDHGRFRQISSLKKKNPLIFKGFQILELWKKNYGLAFFVFYKNNSVPLPYPNSHQKEGGEKSCELFLKSFPKQS